MLDRRAALALLAAAASPLAAAAEPPRAADSPFTAELLRTGLYLIRGGGAHSLMRLSPAGALLVDGKSSGHYRPLMSQLRRINKLSDLPVRVLALTSAGDSQAANASLFALAGVALLAPEQTLARIGASATVAGKTPAPRVPFVGSYQLSLGGVDIHCHHVGPARTDGDAVVLFPDMRVAAIGELVQPAGPAPDAALGGSLAHWAAALDRTLALPADTFVPSSGDPLSRAELQAYRAQVARLAPTSGA